MQADDSDIGITSNPRAAAIEFLSMAEHDRTQNAVSRILLLLPLFSITSHVVRFLPSISSRGKSSVAHGLDPLLRHGVAADTHMDTSLERLGTEVAKL